MFTPQDIARAIKSLKREKAPGPDDIDPEHPCFTGPIAQLELCKIFNAILACCYIPEMFTLGLVTAIPKGADKDLRNPSNYRGISLLSNVGKLLEKLILDKLSADGISLNHLQGGFRVGYSSIHTAFVFQESVQSLRDLGKKAFVAFLDVKKAFDTVWHEGLFVKLHEKNIHPRIWHLLVDWYSRSSSCFLLKGKRSRVFSIKQGVRQGAILSPLLYSVYVDALLVQLDECCLGAMVGSVHCPSLMYADDLSLIADTPVKLQSLLDIVSDYASAWRYEINSSKSAVLIFGELSKSRSSGRLSRSFFVCRETIQEADSYSHLGILRLVTTSGLAKISNRCSAGRSAFFALNSIGARFGCLHPITSHKLYSSLCLPVTLYGSEFWSLTKTELTMLERSHRKILRTIQGLPTRCPLTCTVEPY